MMFVVVIVKRNEINRDVFPDQCRHISL